MGVVIGDALGCTVQFMSREKLIARGLVTGMEGYGSFHVPEGTWTDDSKIKKREFIEEMCLVEI